MTEAELLERERLARLVSLFLFNPGLRSAALKMVGSKTEVQSGCTQ
jgi:hypothetical protein